MGSHLELRVMTPSILILLANLSGCGSPRSNPPTVEPPAQTVETAVAEVEERFLTTSLPEDNLDSLAVAPNQGWVIGTSKGTHQLVVFDADSGHEVRRVGSEGSAPGDFRRPNGIAVADDTVFVVERDNARVQLLSLPGLEPLGLVGEGVLERPYGVAIHPVRTGVFDVYVTDQFDLQLLDRQGHPRLTERVKQFRVERLNDGIRSSLIRTIGDEDGAGALWKVETIAVDPELDRLLVADEHSQRIDVKVYTLDGRFTGATFGRGILTSEPEGIALWPCGDGGVWVVTDQHETVSLFHLFDRRTLEHLGVFAGGVTANTDGIALNPLPSGAFPGGALYAVDDDRRMAAFHWTDVAKSQAELAACPPE
jgi:3-phytase